MCYFCTEKNKSFWCQKAASWALRLLRGISLPCEFIPLLELRCWEAASLRVATVALWQITLSAAILPFLVQAPFARSWPTLGGEYGTILFTLQMASVVSRVAAPVFSMPPLRCFLQGPRGGGGAQLNSYLLGSVTWCCSHVAALSCSLTWWGCFQPCSYGPTLPVTSSSGIYSLILLSWTFLLWGGRSWTLGSLPLLGRAPKCLSQHCSQHPMCPSSCADAKDFLLLHKSELWWVLLIN